ncbi:MAG: hypothetical protein LBS59_00935, partial [Puniceicoccales bacterium]|nr:hypothetical protein [Puniceicoccales bacterium]
TAAPEIFAAANVLDNDRYTYWATDDKVTTGELILTLPAAVEFDVVRLRENIKLGHRVGKFAVDIDENGKWREVFTGEVIAANRLLRSKTLLKTNRVRLRIIEARAPLAISDFALFRVAK